MVIDSSLYSVLFFYNRIVLSMNQSNVVQLYHMSMKREGSFNAGIVAPLIYAIVKYHRVQSFNNT